jgi:chemotaxis response regulator CheB
MDKDRAELLYTHRKAGAFTIAQDEATSVVYGMPKVAAELGAAVAVLPLPNIGASLASRLKARA